MGNVMDDVSSELSMILRKYEQLQANNPEHELLRLATIHEDRGGLNWSKDFWEKCSNEGEPHSAMRAYMRYHTFLEKALSGKPYHFVDHLAYGALENLRKSLKNSYEQRLGGCWEEKRILTDVLREVTEAVDRKATADEILQISADRTSESGAEKFPITDVLNRVATAINSGATNDEIGDMLAERINLHL